MTRLLLLLLLSYLAWRGVESLMGRLRISAGAAGRPLRPRRPPGGGEGGETLTPCAVCGVHVPRSRALAGARGELYCSEECRPLTP